MDRKTDIEMAGTPEPVEHSDHGAIDRPIAHDDMTEAAAELPDAELPHAELPDAELEHGDEQSGDDNIDSPSSDGTEMMDGLPDDGDEHDPSSIGATEDFTDGDDAEEDTGGDIAEPATQDDAAIPNAAFDTSPLIDSPPPVATAPLREGYLDQVEEGGWAAGWTRWFARGPKIELDVFIDGHLVDRIVADQYREDLQRLYGEPNVAFWFGIPEALLDGQDHAIDVRYADTGESIDGSPQVFSIATLRAGGLADSFNLIPNAAFQQWPAGLSVRPSKRFEEVAEGWYFDARKGTTPNVQFRPERPSDLALADDDYAINVVVKSGGNDGFMRLIVPIDTTNAGRDLFFSMGIRRPVHAANDATHIAEVFLANARDGAVERIKTLRKGMRPRGTQRVLNIPLGLRLSELDESVVPAIVIDFRGDGAMTLFSPELSNAPTQNSARHEAFGMFEDPAIRGQVATLALAPIWHQDAIVTAIRHPKQPPEAIAHTATDRTLSAIPFIQIVIPVFNAGLDVEECLRALIDSTDTPFEALLFDDGSGEYAVSRIEAWTRIDPRIRYIRHRANVGYTSNVNIGLQSAVSEFAVLLNSDTIVTPGWLRKLYEIISADDRIAGVGPVSNAASWQSVPFTKASSGDWIVNSFGDDHPPHVVNALLETIDDGTSPVFPLLNGFCTLFRRSALAEIGYFDDASFPRGYGEENDLCIRLGKAGFDLRVATNTYVHHKKSRSFGHDQRKDLSKKANAILRGKYPELDFGKLEERMRTEPSINILRRRLLDLLKVEPAL